jgi:hypothetical protein
MNLINYEHLRIAAAVISGLGLLPYVHYFSTRTKDFHFKNWSKLKRKSFYVALTAMLYQIINFSCAIILLVDKENYYQQLFDILHWYLLSIMSPVIISFTFELIAFKYSRLYAPLVNQKYGAIFQLKFILNLSLLLSAVSRIVGHALNSFEAKTVSVISFDLGGTIASLSSLIMNWKMMLGYISAATEKLEKKAQLNKEVFSERILVERKVYALFRIKMWIYIVLCANVLSDVIGVVLYLVSLLIGANFYLIAVPISGTFLTGHALINLLMIEKFYFSVKESLSPTQKPVTVLSSVNFNERPDAPPQVDLLVS